MIQKNLTPEAKRAIVEQIAKALDEDNVRVYGRRPSADVTLPDLNRVYAPGETAYVFMAIGPKTFLEMQIVQALQDSKAESGAIVVPH